MGNKKPFKQNLIKALNGDLIEQQTNISYNWDFEQGGNDYGPISWIVDSGKAFLNQPIRGDSITAAKVDPNMVPLGGDYWKNSPYPVGHQGDYLIMSDIEATGLMFSKNFELENRYIGFLIAGVGNCSDCSIDLELLDSPDNTFSFGTTSLPYGYTKVLRATPFKGPTVKMQRVWWDVETYMRRIARIVIRDNNCNGSILADDFVFSDVLPDSIQSIENHFSTRRLL